MNELYERGGRRALDVAVAMTALVILAPLLILFGLIVRASMGAPVLYAESRAGRYGRPFVLRKFRTMTDARGVDGRLLPDEQRLTPIGRVMRRYSVDELPGLLSVVSGDMSLVGPRPLPVRYVDRYTAVQARRLLVRPGVTGLAQVRGRNELTWRRKFALDAWYVEHRSLGLDLKVLLLTLIVVIKGTGISHPGHATMHEFLGAPR